MLEVKKMNFKKKKKECIWLPPWEKSCKFNKINKERKYEKWLEKGKVEW